MFSQHQSATHDGTILDARSTTAAHITSLPDEILPLIFSQGLWEDKFEIALTMLNLAKTCRRLAMLAELSQVNYVAYLEGSTLGFYAGYRRILRMLVRNPRLGGHIQKATCKFGDITDDNLEAFTPHDWELARATIHRVCHLDAWNGQCRSRFYPRDLAHIAPSQDIDNAPDILPDVALRSDNELDLEEIQIPSITRGKLETEWVRLLELSDYNAMIALFLTLAFGLKKVEVCRSDYGEWGIHPDSSTLSQNLVPILLIGAANLQHEQEILSEASGVSIMPYRHAKATILPRLVEVEIDNACHGYCDAPMKIATPWLLLPNVKKAQITRFGNENINHWEPQVIPWTPVPGLTLGLESLRLVSCGIPCEGLGLLVRSCPSLKSLVFHSAEGMGGDVPTSCIHPQDLMPHLLAIAHSLEYLDLDGLLWANGHSFDLRSAKDPETLFILGYRNGGQTLDNQIVETASTSVLNPVWDSSVPMSRYIIRGWFNVDTRFGSFRAFTKLRSLVLKAERLGISDAQNLFTELVFILPGNLERLWIKDYQTESNYNLVAELVRLANMRGEGSFARLKSITLGDYYWSVDERGSELRELCRLCEDVGISLSYATDETEWWWHHDDGEYYPWEENLY